MTTTRTACGSKTRVVVGPEINVWTGGGVYVQNRFSHHRHGPVSYHDQFPQEVEYYGKYVHPNGGNPFVPAIILSEPPPMPPNVGWWVNQPVITGPSSTEMELRFQRETKFQYFGDSGHSGHRRHGLQPPVGPPNLPPPVGPNPTHPQNHQGGNGGSGRPHGLQPQPQK